MTEGRHDDHADTCLNQDTFTIQVLDSRGAAASRCRAPNVRDFTVRKDSPMPSYRDKLTLGGRRRISSRTSSR